MPDSRELSDQSATEAAVDVLEDALSGNVELAHGTGWDRASWVEYSAEGVLEDLRSRGWDVVRQNARLCVPCAACGFYAIPGPCPKCGNEIDADCGGSGIASDEERAK